MRDLLRLAHPHTDEPVLNALFNYIVKGEATPETEDLLPPQLLAMRRAAGLGPVTKDSVRDVVALIRQYNLPREAVPNFFLNSVEVWEALLEHMPLTAMIRSLGKMTAVGLINPLSEGARLVAEKLGSAENLQRARVHPINILAALLIYKQGRGDKGSLTWSPNSRVIDALDDAFYASFKAIEPSGKRILIGLDVSGSMGMHNVNGFAFMQARQAAAAMSMAVARVEKNWHVMAFSSKFVPLEISPRQRLDDILKTTAVLPFGPTDVSLPMTWALQNKVEVDAFAIYTDNETYYGDIHPVQALQKYRQATGIPARMLVNAMVATEFSVAAPAGRGYGTFNHGTPRSVADPNDGGMLDVAGLDSAAPQVMADFIRG